MRIVFFGLLFVLILLLIYAVIKGLMSINTGKKDKAKNASIADELLKLQNLREEGIISEKEFEQMKKKLLK